MSVLVLRAATQITCFRILNGDFWALAVSPSVAQRVFEILPAAPYYYKPTLTTLIVLVAPVVFAVLTWSYAPACSRFLRWTGATGIFASMVMALAGVAISLASYGSVSPFAYVGLPFIAVGTSDGVATCSLNRNVRFEVHWHAIDRGFSGTERWAMSRYLPKESLKLTAPFWMICWAFALPSIALYLAARRPLPGNCPCGYNLFGNTSGVCPECGSPIKGTAMTQRNSDQDTSVDASRS